MWVCCGLNLKLIHSADSGNTCPLYRMECLCLLPVTGLFLPSSEKQMQTLGRVPGFWRECYEGKAKVGTLLLFFLSLTPSLPLFLVLIHPQYFADVPDFFYTGCCAECLQMTAGSEAGMVRYQALSQQWEVFCSLRDLLFAQSFLIFVSSYLGWFFLYVCSKIKLFDDDFLCSLFLSDFGCVRVF